MIRITIRFGLDTITRTFDQNVTVKQIKSDREARTILGYGDNVKAIVNGVEQGDDVLLPPGSNVVMETAQNTKA